MAVFGGSFDPVHNGHLFLAGEIVRRGMVDEVLFVPAANPPHKLGRRLTSAQHRHQMLIDATKPFAKFSVSDIELNRGSEPSYTISTLEMIARVFPDHEMWFLMGMDSLVDLHIWHMAGELANRFSFLVYPRPGVEPPSLGTLSAQFGARIARKLRDAILDLNSLPISSSEVREHCRARNSLAGLVPASVGQYLAEHNLYDLD